MIATRSSSRRGITVSIDGAHERGDGGEVFATQRFIGNLDAELLFDRGHKHQCVEGVQVVLSASELHVIGNGGVRAEAKAFAEHRFEDFESGRMVHAEMLHGRKRLKNVRLLVYDDGRHIAGGTELRAG